MYCFKSEAAAAGMQALNCSSLLSRRALLSFPPFQQQRLRPSLIVHAVEKHGSPVSLLFRVPYETVLGEELLISGQGNEALGEWVPQKGIKLEWTQGHQWRSGSVQASPDSVLKFKVVLLRGSNHVYEPGPDRILDCASQAHEGQTEVLCCWGQPCQLLPLAGPDEATESDIAAPPSEEQQAALPVEPLQAVEASAAVEAAPASCSRQASPHSMLCTFTVPFFETQLGQYLVLVGSSQELGAWVPESGLPMQWRPGHAWHAELPVSAAEDVEFKLAWFNGGDFVWETGPNRTLCGLDSFIGKQEGAVSENAQAHIICPWEAPLQLTRMQASDSSAEQQQQQHSVANDADRAAAAGKTDLTASSAVALEVPDTEDTTLAWAVAALAAAEEADGDGRQQQAVQEYLLSNMNGNSNSTTTNAVGRGSRDSSLGEQAVEQEQVVGQPDARDAEIQVLIEKRQAAEWALHAQRTAAAEAAMGQQRAQEEVRAAEARAQQLSQELRAAQQQAEQLAIEAQEKMIALGLELAGLRQRGRMQTKEMSREMEGMRQEIREMALKQAEQMKLRNQELAEVQAKHAAQVDELRTELENVRKTARCQLELAESEVEGLKWQLLQAQADLQDHERRLQESVAAREALVKQHAQELKEQQEAQLQQLQDLAQQQQAMRVEQEAVAASSFQRELQAANERAQEMERTHREEQEAMKELAESQVLALQNELSEMRAQRQGATAQATAVSQVQAGDLKQALGQSQEEVAQLKSFLEKANMEKVEEIARLKESLAHHKREVTRMRSELRSGARLTEGLRAELAHSQFDLQDLRNQLAAREVLVQNLQRELEDLEEAMEDIKHSISRGLGMVIVPPQQLRQEKPASLQSRPAEQEQLQHVALCDKQEEQQQQQQQDQEPRKGLLGFISSLFGNNGRGKGTQASGPSSGTANNVVAAEGLSATEVSRREQMSARR